MTYSHPISGDKLSGIRLGWGATSQDGDLYDSTGGKWLPMPCVGTTVHYGCQTIIVRPENRVARDYTWNPNNTLGFDVFAHERKLGTN